MKVTQKMAVSVSTELGLSVTKKRIENALALSPDSLEAVEFSLERLVERLGEVDARTAAKLNENATRLLIAAAAYRYQNSKESCKAVKGKLDLLTSAEFTGEVRYADRAAVRGLIVAAADIPAPTECPVCGGRIEATVAVYVDCEDTLVVRDVDMEDARFYCENDHHFSVGATMALRAKYRHLSSFGRDPGSGPLDVPILVDPMFRSAPPREENDAAAQVDVEAPPGPETDPGRNGPGGDE